MTKVLDIGCGLHKVTKDAIGMDQVQLPGVDVVHDLEKFPYPFDANEFDEVHANMVLEHMHDLQGVMREIRRILKPNGCLYAKVPYYSSLAAFQDYTHKHFFTEKTFSYFTKENELNYYSGITYEIMDQKLVANANSSIEKLRNLIPFRHLLKFVFLNMYDELHIVLKKVD